VALYAGIGAACVASMVVAAVVVACRRRSRGRPTAAGHRPQPPIQTAAAGVDSKQTLPTAFDAYVYIGCSDVAKIYGHQFDAMLWGNTPYILYMKWEDR